MRPLKILLITDNVSVGLVAARYLNAQGFALSTAADTELALAKLAESPVDLVVLDELGGPACCLATLSRIRQCPEACGVPVLLGLESTWDRATREAAEGQGEVMFIDHPFDKMARLLDHIRRILAVQAVADAADDAFDEVFQELESFVPSAPPPEDPDVGCELDDIIFPAGPDGESADRWVLKRCEVRAQGSLVEVEIAELLCRCLEAQYDGVLLVTLGPVSKRMFIRQGVPVYVESDQADERFGAFVHRLGRLTTEQFESLQRETAHTGRKQGELMLQRGWISPHELYQLLVEQVTDKILACFAWCEGTYQLVPGQLPDPEVVPLRLEFARLVLDGIARHYDDERLARHFPEWPRMKVFRLPHGRLRLEQLLLTTTEARLWDLAERGSTVGELERHAAGGRLEARRLLGGLFLLGWLGYERVTMVAAPHTPLPPVARPRRAVRAAPAPPPSALVTVQEKELLDDLDRLEGVDHFLLLGVDPEGDIAEVHEAFRERAKRYHPDKLLRFSFVAQRRGAEHYRRLVAAYQVLADGRQREVYAAELRGDSSRESAGRRGPGAALPGQTPFPEMSREALMRALRKWLLEKEYDRAVRQLAAVRKVEPDDAQYMAWHGWALFLQSPEVHRREAEKLLADARKVAPDHPDPLFLTGRLREWDGAHAKALDFYVKASTKNPYDVDLAREARLLEMRLRKGIVKKRGPRKPDAALSASDDEDRGMLDQDVGAIFRKMFRKK